MFDDDSKALRLIVASETAKWKAYRRACAERDCIADAKCSDMLLDEAMDKVDHMRIVWQFAFDKRTAQGI